MPKDTTYTIADRRLDALETYRKACDDPAGADWRGVADMLAAVVPIPKASKPLRQDSKEWEAYPESVIRQRGRNFRPSRGAEFLFRDGTVILAPLLHHHKRAAPDWARAARMAVHFYRARFAPGQKPPIEVPEIDLAYDPLRQVLGDADRATNQTEELRRGVPLIARIAAE